MGAWDREGWIRCGWWQREKGRKGGPKEEISQWKDRLRTKSDRTLLINQWQQTKLTYGFMFLCVFVPLSLCIPSSLCNSVCINIHASFCVCVFLRMCVLLFQCQICLWLYKAVYMCVRMEILIEVHSSYIPWCSSCGVCMSDILTGGSAISSSTNPSLSL